MKEKMVNGLKRVASNKVVIGATTLGLSTCPLFAGDGTSTALATLESTLQGVASESVSAVGTIAGIALTIFAAKFVWTWGIGFFSKLARK